MRRLQQAESQGWWRSSSPCLSLPKGQRGLGAAAEQGWGAHNRGDGFELFLPLAQPQDFLEGEAIPFLLYTRRSSSSALLKSPPRNTPAGADLALC